MFILSNLDEIIIKGLLRTIMSGDIKCKSKKKLFQTLKKIKLLRVKLTSKMLFYSDAIVFGISAVIFY